MVAYHRPAAVIGHSGPDRGIELTVTDETTQLRA